MHTYLFKKFMNDDSAGNIKIEQFTSTHQAEDPDLPPDNLTSEFKTVQEWLESVCTGKSPQKQIDVYEFDLFESVDDYTLCLYGTNTEEQGNDSITSIDFRPSDMYYRLPENEYKNLTREILLSNLTIQLRSFTETELFKTSFLAQAKSIMVSFNGQKIW